MYARTYSFKDPTIKSIITFNQELKVLVKCYCVKKQIELFTFINLKILKPLDMYNETYNTHAQMKINIDQWQCWAHAWFHSYAPKLVPILYYCDKTRVKISYFLDLRLSFILLTKDRYPYTLQRHNTNNIKHTGTNIFYHNHFIS